MREAYRAVKFLFLAPFIVALLFVINVMTWSGHWWVQWAALGLGIAWVLSVFRVIKALLVGGGLLAIASFLRSQRS